MFIFKMTMKTVCQFNKFGFCKFGVTCRHLHFSETCENKLCEISNCLKRHPTMCKYFKIYNRCKFGSFCSYVCINIVRVSGNRFGGHCVTFYCISDLFTQHPQFTDGLGKKLWEDKMTSWENHIFVKTFANWTKANLKKWQKI